MADQKAAVGKTALEVIPVGRAPPPGKAPPPKKSSAPPPDGKGVVPKPAASLPIGHRVNVKSLPGKAAPEVEKLRATLAERKANNAKAQDQQLTTDSTSVAGRAAGNSYCPSRSKTEGEMMRFGASRLASVLERHQGG